MLSVALTSLRVCNNHYFGSNNQPGCASFLQVCDMYLKYNLPLLIMPPAGVFYPALLSMDSVNLNQLCHIMYRYYNRCGLQGLLVFPFSLLEMKLLCCKNLESASCRARQRWKFHLCPAFMIKDFIAVVPTFFFFQSVIQNSRILTSFLVLFPYLWYVKEEVPLLLWEN